MFIYCKIDDTITVLANTYSWSRTAVTINGGSGNDTYILEAGYADNIIEASDGNDVIILGNFNDSNKKPSLIQSGDDLIINYNSYTLGKPFASTLTLKDYYTSLDKYNSWIFKDNNKEPSVILSMSDFIKYCEGDLQKTTMPTNGNDWIEGNNQATLNALDGHDIINSNKNNKIINGGAGNDIIFGCNDKNLLIQTLNGDDGDDVIYAKAGSGLSVTMSETYKNYINGGAGDDIIYGASRIDSMCYIENYLNGGDGDDTIYAFSPNSYQTGVEITTIYGEDGNDIIYGGRATIYGGNGNDTIYANSDKRIEGNDGDDYIEGHISCQRDSVWYNDVNRVVEFYHSKIFINENEYIDIVNSKININGEKSDFDYSYSYGIYGGNGNDTIKSYDGLLNGGAGDDIYHILNEENFNKGNVLITDSEGNDKIIYSNYNHDNLKFVINVNRNGEVSNFYKQGCYEYNYNSVVITNEYVEINEENTIDDLVYKAQDMWENSFVSAQKQEEIERYETADGYYITKEQLNSIIEQVASYLSTTDYADVASVIKSSYTEKGKNVFETLISENYFGGLDWQKNS